MQLSTFMSRLKMSDPPASWIRNFDQVRYTLADHVMPADEDICLFCSRHKLPEKQQAQLLSCRAMILANKDYLLLWHLYYMILLVIHDCEAEHWQNWPSPAVFPAGEFSVFRSLLMLAHLDALADKVSFRNLPDSFIQDGVDSLIAITARHFADEGYYGVSNNKMWWQQLFMRAMIFQVGRLQFEISRYNSSFRVYRSRSGDTVILCAASDERYDEQGLQAQSGIYHPFLWEGPRSITGYGFDLDGCLCQKKSSLTGGCGSGLLTTVMMSCRFIYRQPAN
jgi:hypothetical protein